MNEGDVVLAVLPQADGRLKNRPAAALRKMPPFDEWLVCGITTQQQHEAEGFDDPIRPGHDDYAASGLKAPSLIRRGYSVDDSRKILVIVKIGHRRDRSHHLSEGVVQDLPPRSAYRARGRGCDPRADNPPLPG